MISLVSSDYYLNPAVPDYNFYVRKHNPLISFKSIASIAKRALRIRNFNDLAVDITANAMPQWSFITPNMVNDAHDTDVDFTSKWLEYFLFPLLKNPKFNSDKTLVLLTFDENETSSINNQVYSVLLWVLNSLHATCCANFKHQSRGAAVPQALKGSKDATYYTHYSTLSNVQANWGLGSLGRDDTNPYVVFSFCTRDRP
jgi:hypothetical protein